MALSVPRVHFLFFFSGGNQVCRKGLNDLSRGDTYVSLCTKICGYLRSAYDNQLNFLTITQLVSWCIDRPRTAFPILVFGSVVFTLRRGC